jgi:lipopolysaccharide export system protein LptA
MSSRTSIKTILFIVLALISAGVSPLSAEVFRFSGTRMSTSLAKGKERTLLRGNAEIRSDDTHITADEIEIFGKDFQFAECRGKVLVRDTKKDLFITCDKLVYDRFAKIIQAEGNAYMEDRKNEIIVRGHRLENRDKEDLTIIQIGVRILKKDLAARAEFARYQRVTDILELSGMPVAFWKKDEYRATRIVMNLETEEITLLGDVTGTIVSESKEKPEATRPEKEDE